MTTQVPDTCMFDGRKWAVEKWDGNYSAIPTNEGLGIETTAESSANWSGRIDHFIVHRDKLYLLKIEVNCFKILDFGYFYLVIHHFNHFQRIIH